MKFVVFCIVLSTIVSLALTLECPVNSREECGSGCCPEITCDRRVVTCTPPRICNKLLIFICRCICDFGYIRDSVSGECVLPRDCPKIKPY
uniref:Trypsin inhibitor-like isoform X1 n=1 Tax=Diabrotica virgifera virgifera TaxID=50390 RepID=A0A6P7FK07_DIAVI